MENDFAKSLMGRKYYTKDLPALIESNNRLAKALEKANVLEGKRVVLETRKQLLNEKRNKTN